MFEDQVFKMKSGVIKGTTVGFKCNKDLERIKIIKKLTIN